MKFVPGRKIVAFCQSTDFFLPQTGLGTAAPDAALNALPQKRLAKEDRATGPRLQVLEEAGEKHIFHAIN